MCRNIKTLFNFDPPATEDELQAAALQYVRKLSGFNTPSKANEAAFRLAVEEVAAASRKLLDSRQRTQSFHTPIHPSSVKLWSTIQREESLHEGDCGVLQ